MGEDFDGNRERSKILVDFYALSVLKTEPKVQLAPLDQTLIPGLFTESVSAAHLASSWKTGPTGVWATACTTRMVKQPCNVDLNKGNAQAAIYIPSAAGVSRYCTDIMGSAPPVL